MTDRTGNVGIGDTPRYGGFEAGLFAATLFAWGTSWFALQINANNGIVSPEASIFYRFIMAALIMLAWVAARRRGLHFPAAMHGRFAIMGGTIFSFNFLCYYHASAALPSGYLALMFSIVSIMNLIVGAALARQWPDPRIGLAALMGIAGIATIFWPEIAGHALNMAALKAMGLCLFANCLFVIGNVVSGQVQKAGVPVIEANALGMVWGGVLSGLYVALKGVPLVFETSLAYIGSLFWLTVFSSVIAFAAYLTLLGRIGAGRVGYLTVMFPVIALLLSTVFEGYRWTVPALIGMVLVLAGNGIVVATLRKPSTPPPPAGS